MIKTKFNITKQEFEKALEFMKEKNTDVVTIEIIPNPIGSVCKISESWDSEQKDITNYDSW